MLQSILLLTLLQYCQAKLLPALGIDFGDESTKIGLIAPGYYMDIVLDEQSRRSTNSLFCYTDQETFFGERAIDRFYSSSCILFDNLLNRTYEASEIGDDLSDINTNWMYDSVKKRFRLKQGLEKEFDSAEALLTIWFGHIRDKTKKFMEINDSSSDVEGYYATINIAHENSYRYREMIKFAANINNIDIVGSISSPFAAAIKYYLDYKINEQEKDKTVVLNGFLDVGANSIDLCFVELVYENGKKFVNEKNCYHNLDSGTKNVDQIVKEIVLEKCKNNIELLEAKSVLVSRLAKKIKEDLSFKAEVEIDLINELNIDCKIKIKNEELQDYLKKSSYLDRLSEFLQYSLNEYKNKNISIEIIGKGWRLPEIYKLIDQNIQKMKYKLSKTCNSDDSVAIGLSAATASFSPGYRIPNFEIIQKAPYEGKIIFLYNNQPFKTIDVKKNEFILGNYKTIELNQELIHFNAEENNFSSLNVIFILNTNKNSQKIVKNLSIQGFENINELRKKSQENIIKNLAKVNFDDPKNVLKNMVDGGWENHNDNSFKIKLSYGFDRLGLFKVDSAIIAWKQLNLKESKEVVVVEEKTIPESIDTTSYEFSTILGTENQILSNFTNESDKNGTNIIYDKNDDSQIFEFDQQTTIPVYSTHYEEKLIELTNFVVRLTKKIKSLKVSNRLDEINIAEFNSLTYLEPLPLNEKDTESHKEVLNRIKHRELKRLNIIMQKNNFETLVFETINKVENLLNNERLFDESNHNKNYTKSDLDNFHKLLIGYSELLHDNDSTNNTITEYEKYIEEINIKKNSILIYYLNKFRELDLFQRAANLKKNLLKKANDLNLTEDENLVKALNSFEDWMNDKQKVLTIKKMINEWDKVQTVFKELKNKVNTEL